MNSWSDVILYRHLVTLALKRVAYLLTYFLTYLCRVYLRLYLLRFNNERWRLLLKGLESLSTAGQMYLEATSERRCRARSGTQVYEVSEPVSDADFVGQPLHHRWAAQCSTGEAVFLDDIPAAHSRLLLIEYNSVNNYLFLLMTMCRNVFTCSQKKISLAFSLSLLT